MATEDREEVQRAEKATLKRKLTGPPRLLLGKTRTRSEGEDRAETLPDKNQTAGEDKSSKCSATAQSETTELTETATPEVNMESSRGRCGAAGEDDIMRKRKVNRSRWWRRFSSAVICNRKQKKNIEESSEEQKNDDSVPPEGVLQETDTAVLKNTEENIKRAKGMRRFNFRAWPTSQGFLTSSDVRRAHEQKREFLEKHGNEPPMTFRRKMQKFFTRGGNSRLSGESLENMEETMRSSAAQLDKPAEHPDNATVHSVEVVTVQTSVQLVEVQAAAETRDQTPEEELVWDIIRDNLRDAVSTSETIQRDGEVVEGPTDTNKTVPVKDSKPESPEKDKVFSTKFILDTEDQLSASTTSSQEVHCEERTDDPPSRSLHPVTNGPFIRIELVPPDDVLQEDEEEECWEGTTSSENHHLLLLLGCEHSERQLLQTARSLVRAAMKAAVDQLTREQHDDLDCVHREPPGCRDHA